MVGRGAVLLALDVGGTNCRVRAVRYRGGELVAHPRLPEPVSRKVDSRESFGDLVREIVASLPHDERPDRAAVAVAGAVRDRRRVRITNWPHPEPFDLDDLARWGLPPAGTLLINDVEAGAHGLTRLLERDGTTSSALIPLASTETTQTGNRVMVVPGTGLGGAGLVRCSDPHRGGAWQPVPSEAGHGPVVQLDEDHGRVITRLRAESAGEWPSWERFVSGPGLESVYRTLRALVPDGREAPRSPGVADTAVAIARAAVDGTDVDAVAALDLYYRCLGRFAQMMALAFTASGGVFIGGGSTRRNRDFIVRGRLLAELRDNAVQRDLLTGIPVFLVLRSLNLLGGLAVAAGDLDTSP